jgi:hypothetical protein
MMSKSKKSEEEKEERVQIIKLSTILLLLSLDRTKYSPRHPVFTRI